MAEFTKGSDDTRDINRCGGGDNGSWRTSLSLPVDVDPARPESLGDVPDFIHKCVNKTKLKCSDTIARFAIANRISGHSNDCLKILQLSVKPYECMGRPGRMNTRYVSSVTYLLMY
jgi:hypothetical protein